MLLLITQNIFVDPVTGVDTQSIENTWMRVKRKQKNKQESVGLYFQHI